MPTITRTVITLKDGKRVKTKQKVKVSKATLAKAVARKKLRDQLKSAPPEVRQAAAALLPKSRRQVARALNQERLAIEELQQKVAATADTATKAALQAEIGKHARALASLVTQATNKQKRALGKRIAGVDAVPPVQAKAKAANVKKAFAAVSQRIAHIEKVGAKGGPVVRAARTAELELLLNQQKHLKRRAVLLKRGFDFEEPRRLPAGYVQAARKRLSLPANFTLPRPAVALVMLRLLAAGLRRLPGESDRDYRLRLREALKRAIVRFVNRDPTLADSRATSVAVQDTLDEDRAVLEAEAQAGGLAEDPAAAAASPLVDPLVDEIEEAAEDYQPAVPGGLPTDSQVGTLLMQAAVLEPELAQAPKEEVDLLEEDFIAPELATNELIDLDVDVTDTEDVRPFWQRPVVWGGAAAVILLLALVGRS